MRYSLVQATLLMKLSKPQSQNAIFNCLNIYSSLAPHFHIFHFPHFPGRDIRHALICRIIFIQFFAQLDMEMQIPENSSAAAPALTSSTSGISLDTRYAHTHTHSSSSAELSALFPFNTLKVGLLILAKICNAPQKKSPHQHWIRSSHVRLSVRTSIDLSKLNSNRRILFSFYYSRTTVFLSESRQNPARV